jgi:hypothetical protein
MRLPFILLALACAFAWTAASLRAKDAAAAAETPIIAAARTTARPVPAARAETSPVEAPPLFRPVSESASGEGRPGESFALVGIVARAQERIALLRDESDQRAWSVRRRDRVGDWTVERIGARCILMRRAGGARQERCL